MENSRITAIIPAAGRPTNTILLHTNLPDTMLPINGKPVIGYILENLLERGIEKSVIALHADDRVTEEYVTKKFGTKLQLTIIRNDDYSRGLGHTIYQAVETVDAADQILIYLGDTVYHGPLEFEDDFVIVSDDYEQPNQWCFIENNGATQCYINKPKTYDGTGSVLVGIYFISDTPTFKNAIRAIDESVHLYELYEPLDRYPRQFKTVPAHGWYDCGNIENYYRAKVDFLRLRSFNTITYNDLYGSITKSSQKKDTLADEINWYKNTPHELKIFAPRLIDYTMSGDTYSYSLEYYGYQSLADYFIFNHFDERVWQIIIDRLFEILGLFTKYTTELPFTFFDDMYRIKTLGRIASLMDDTKWHQRFTAKEIFINGVPYQGWPTFAEKLPSLVEYLYKNSTMSFMHGDVHPSNILFDPHSRIFKFIDPRGNFGEQSVYGDHNYDIAKLRHGFSGRYDFIIGDLFETTETTQGYTYQTFHETAHEQVAEYFDTALKRAGHDLNIVRTIEALLFISMIPIHSNAPLRQQAMFLTGIKLLNSLRI
jgi:choline kinase